MIQNNEDPSHLQEDYLHLKGRASFFVCYVEPGYSVYR